MTPENKQASAPALAESIDTPEFRKLLRQIGNWHSAYTTDEIIDQAVKHIDSIITAHPARQGVPANVDWLGLALDLEAQAKRVESYSAERAMKAAAHGLRMIGAAPAAPQAVVSDRTMQAVAATLVRAGHSEGEAQQLAQQAVVPTGELPQPYAGVIVLLETFADCGMVAYVDGVPTPNRNLCIRFASELRAALNAQAAGVAVDAALDACAEISAEYQSRASDGKLGSIRRNRNNWKVDAANECYAAILKLKLATPTPAVQAVPGDLDRAYRELADAEACFGKAYIEGLTAALAETKDENLKDLVERRILHAQNHILSAMEAIVNYPAVQAGAMDTLRKCIEHEKAAWIGDHRKAAHRALDDLLTRFNIYAPMDSAVQAGDVRDAGGPDDFGGWDGDPIPKGVFYVFAHDNFYDAATHKGMGTDFYIKWRAAAVHFPRNATEAASPAEKGGA